ncbi:MULTISPECIES: zinc dependent phospholipase C family protein [Romboutsia]|uniref:Phospholipase C n=1 Tax=Romboutsia hominis TaxID=1507512 RepID=A0A2P2BUC1_9FIRM|nr:MULTISPECIES: zinc dependent phospholipase C family protein [Romboutsia]MDB8789590.1 zinc dependent phospholipase C family protein [Romboutsia sp. 1001216sp1]MDB8802733.1 zinc dependent phospholipase C family protein [Romboutsia sp. 1001216sp1]MDB8814130.1 zinc dependent phospholipase C family protein [Romboutsia sp. 1001216sp1]CEI73961.1 Phospholipase C zinc-binding protein [Romboutsia hominis]
MKKKIEGVYAKALTNTFKFVNPIKKSIIKTTCEVHLFINENSLEILKKEGSYEIYNFFKEYVNDIERGLVWADQDFKSYHHFYNPKEGKGKYGYEDNALTVAIGYYDKAKKYFKAGNYTRSMFFFGAACHIIQDLTIPQHAKGRLLDNHRQFEVYVKNNYKKIKRFKAHEEPILLNSIKEYADYNSMYALNVDYMYKNVTDLNTKFYLIAVKSINIAQRTTAGCMVMFFEDVMHLN